MSSLFHEFRVCFLKFYHKICFIYCGRKDKKYFFVCILIAISWKREDFDRLSNVSSSMLETESRQITKKTNFTSTSRLFCFVLYNCCSCKARTIRVIFSFNGECSFVVTQWGILLEISNYVLDCNKSKKQRISMNHIMDRSIIGKRS